jgi:hypothetical protein
MMINQSKKFHEQHYRISAMETDKFINYEKRRLGLNKKEIWNKKRISDLFEKYEEVGEYNENM